VNGSLTLVATPIGNLGDITPRAIDALRVADLVCCEDTRRTGLLLHHLGIEGKRYMVVNDHTEYEACEEIIGEVMNGKRVVLVTDAGTPGISDPGERLVRAALESGLEVDSAPGVSAVTMALAASGLSTERFVFEGFLPAKGGERAERLAQIGDERRTVVLYEAPHRVERTLQDLEVACGPRRLVVIARELTKVHEEFWRGPLHDAVRHVAQSGVRGEYVLVLEGAKPPGPATDDDIIDALRTAIADGSSKRDAAAKVAAMLGAPKRRVYELALALT
jgi:16S rRNA (cytidine1402-2'-O)-methyltransferase